MINKSLMTINDTLDQEILFKTKSFHELTNNYRTVDVGNYKSSLPTSVDSIKAIESAEYTCSGVPVASTVFSDAKHDRKPSSKQFIDTKTKYSTFIRLLQIAFGKIGLKGMASRSYPSAGGIYSCQVIVWVRNVEGLVPGAYHFLPVSNKLEMIRKISDEEAIASFYFNGHIADGMRLHSFGVLYAMMIGPAIFKYGYRGYRMATMEVGAMYQSLTTLAQKEGLSSRVWGAFDDNSLACAMGIDPRVALPMIFQFVGKEHDSSQ